MNKFVLDLLIVYLVSVAVVYCVPPSKSVHRRSPPSSAINLPPFYGRIHPRSVINYSSVYGKSPPRSVTKSHHVNRLSPPSSAMYLPNLYMTEIVVSLKYVEVKRVGNDGGGQNRDNGGGGFKSWNTIMVVAVLVGGVSALLFTCCLLGFCFYKLGKRKGASHVRPSSHSASDADEVTNMNVTDGYGLMSIQDLENATGNFSRDNILGSGGFGTVYKGELHDGTKVAVKRMESGVMSPKVFQQFKSEIEVLTKVGHRHLVKLLGYCLDGNERLLVFEYMPQGTLARFLFDWKQQGLKPLEWTQRLTIGLDVARGIEYLHGLAHHSYIHRDLKPSNILLADDMRAKVADFGFVRPAPHGEYSYVSRLAGTFGYIPPELAGSGQVTKKGDVYSFGVILMELITGRRALNVTPENRSLTLVKWFLQMHKDKAAFQGAIDPNLDLDEKALFVVSTVAELAVYCCASEPHRRPNISHVVRVLSSIAEPWNPSESESDSDDPYKTDIVEETLPSVVEPAVHDYAFEPHQTPDKSLAVGVISSPAETWNPSIHHPDADSDADDSHETEHLRHRIRRTSSDKTQAYHPPMDGHDKQLRLQPVPDEVTRYIKQILGSKANPMDWMMPLSESRSENGRWSCIWMMFPCVFQLHSVILFGWKPSEAKTLARKVILFTWRSFECGPDEATQAHEKTPDSSDMHRMGPLWMPLSGRGRGSRSWRCIPLVFPSTYQVYMVILFGLNLSEHETLARRVIPLDWNPSDSDDAQETEIHEETSNPGSRLKLSLMTTLMKKPTV